MRTVAVPGTLLLTAVTVTVAVTHAFAGQRAAPPAHDFTRFAPSIHRQLAGHLEGGYAFAVMHGGAIVTPKIPIPSGVFVLFTDPAGNRMGLFQAKTP